MFFIIDGMVADGIAEPGQFSVIECDERGWPTGPPFAPPSELAHQAAGAGGS